jgi:hypothetical protein
MEVVFHMDFPIRPSPSPTGHTLANKNLIIFINFNMLHRMEHDKMLTEEEEAILLQDELPKPPSSSSTTNKQEQKQQGVMGDPVLPESKSNGGEEAQKALEGLKGLRVDDGEMKKKKKKNKSGAEKKRRRKANLAATEASASGTAAGLPPAPTTPKPPTAEEPKVPRRIVVARPPRQDTTKSTVGFHIPQQRQGDGQGPSTGPQGPPRAQKRALTSPDSPEERKPPKRSQTYRQVAEGALRVFVTYSDTGRGSISATDYSSICGELRKARSTSSMAKLKHGLLEFSLVVVM